MKRILLIIVVASLFFNCRKESKTSGTERNVSTIEIDEQSKDSVIEVVEAPIKKSNNELKKELSSKGFKTMDYIIEETNDTILMQQYFMAIVKEGPIRGQNEEESAELQREHMAYIKKMHQLGYADISGAFDAHANMRAVTIYNVPTQKMADSLANADPMVQADRLQIEIHPWWAQKGASLK